MPADLASSPAPAPSTDLVDSAYQLDDNLKKDTGRVFLTGTQALVRMLLAQRRLDIRDGRRTAGFVSGYRGSPLAGLDFELWKSRDALTEAGIVFVPGVNEDLAATAVMGSQHAGTDPARNCEGVFGLWYGKGPGLDRAGDALRHGHAAGASRQGGVLMVVGDDHAATSSSIPNASDLSLMGWSVPIVHPASIEEYQAFGLWGWAASRFSGCWVAFKAISETVESGRSIELSPLTSFVEPTDFVSKVGPLEFRTSDFLTLAIEQRLAEKLRAFETFAELNSLDRVIVDPPSARIGIITVGKVHFDVMAALERGGLSPDRLSELGVRVYKPGLVWPLNQTRLRAFAKGLTHVLVVEEKASVVEQQVKEMLFNLPDNERPLVVGKRNAQQQPLIPWVGQLRPAQLAPALFGWLATALDRPFDDAARCASGVAPSMNPADLRRLPYFCSGCPHNTSTRLPAGSQALAGVGCHYMASWMDRATGGLTQMGGEGADWVGWSRFTRTPHMFQNMGEGTYFHSGFLAIRQAIAARTNITYKILFNDAVAMTGGQPVDGILTVPQICAQLVAEGAKRVAVTTDDPERYQGVQLPAGVQVLHRRELERLQRELRDIPGVTALVHDQTCAAEKRRRRKRSEYPDPPRRLFINEAVCEACGDCGVQSNCVSIVPQATPFGTKRRIDQSSCNKDYSCAEGFCPSFVSVIGGGLRKGSQSGMNRRTELLALAQSLPMPAPDTFALSSTAEILIAGVGGTGVITIGQVVAMAAHLEARTVSVLDFTALAQKGGSVLSHLRIGAMGPVRVDWQQADTLIACDLVVGTLPDALGAIRGAHTMIVGNRNVASLAEFTRDGEAVPKPEQLIERLQAVAGPDKLRWLNATEEAVSLFGDSIATNMLMLGAAWQLGRVPVSWAAIDRAIELNKVAVQANRDAFNIGRVLASRLGSKSELPTQTIQFHVREEGSTALERRAEFLVGYQDQAMAQLYRSAVKRLADRAAAQLGPRESARLADAYARNLFKLMAVKDEYEVARLHSTPAFRAALDAQFDGDYRIEFHLAPPMLARRHPSTGKPLKRTFGPWLLPVLRGLAGMRWLRGTPLDLFGITHERREERRLRQQYQRAVDQVLEQLTAERFDTALAIIGLPDSVRGYGHVKAAAIARFDSRLAELLKEWASPAPATRAAPVATVSVS